MYSISWFTRALCYLCLVAYYNHVQVDGQLTPAQMTAFLDSHNAYRRLTAMGQTGFGNRTQPAAADLAYLQWDDVLADIAQNMTNQCNYNHMLVNTTKYSYVGQNIDRNVDNSPIGIANAYFEEWFFYRGLNNRAADIYDIPYPTGHYTQLVWNSTKFIGCGTTYCPALQSYVSFCNYGPGGNLVGAVPYTPGPACSRCKPDYPFCMNGLCASKAICAKSTIPCTCNVQCANGGVLDPVNCVCTKCPSTMVSFFCDKPCKDTLTSCYVSNTICTTYVAWCQATCGQCTFQSPNAVPSNRNNIISSNYSWTLPEGFTFQTV